MVPTDLETIAAALGGSVETSNAATARRMGIAVKYKLADRGVGSAHEPWTEVSAELPAHYPLHMKIERGRAKPGELKVDIELGTPLFDEFFLVEAAPSDVVRHLVDDQARQFLLAQSGLVELSAYGRTLQYATIGWIESAAKAIELADYVAGLASRVRDAYAAADVEPILETNDPYRPQHRSTGEDVQARRAEELDNLREVERMRYEHHQGRDRVIVWSIVAVVAVGILIGVLVSS